MIKVEETLFFAKGRVNKLFVKQREEGVEVYFAKFPSPSSKAKFIISIYEGLREKGYTHNEIIDNIQKEFDICKSTIYKYLRISKMDERSLEYLDRGKLTQEACYMFAKLDVTERETIYKLLDRYPASKITESKARALFKEIKRCTSNDAKIIKILLQ